MRVWVNRCNLASCIFAPPPASLLARLWSLSRPAVTLLPIPRPALNRASHLTWFTSSPTTSESMLFLATMPALLQRRAERACCPTLCVWTAHWERLLGLRSVHRCQLSPSSNGCLFCHHISQVIDKFTQTGCNVRYAGDQPTMHATTSQHIVRHIGCYTGYLNHDC